MSEWFLAIATVILALGTVWLAFSTRSLALSTSKMLGETREASVRQLGVET